MEKKTNDVDGEKNLVCSFSLSNFDLFWRAVLFTPPDSRRRRNEEQTHVFCFFLRYFLFPPLAGLPGPLFSVLLIFFHSEFAELLFVWLANFLSVFIIMLLQRSVQDMMSEHTTMPPTPLFHAKHLYSNTTTSGPKKDFRMTLIAACHPLCLSLAPISPLITCVTLSEEGRGQAVHMASLLELLIPL